MSRQFLSSVICLLLCQFFWGCASAKNDQKVLERHLGAVVPLQSTSDQILEYLNREKIDHSKYFRNASDERVIEAVIRDRSKWASVKTDYGVVFRFDQSDRLTAYEVHLKYTGP